MSEQQNVDIVKRGYECFGKGDLDGLIQLMSENVEWSSPGPADLPTAGHRQGHDQVRQFFGTLNELYVFEQFDPQQFVAQGDTVVVLGIDRVVVKATGKAVEAAWAHAFTVRNGTIVRFQEYVDTAAVMTELRSAQSRT